MIGAARQETNFIPPQESLPEESNEHSYDLTKEEEKDLLTLFEAVKEDSEFLYGDLTPAEQKAQKEYYLARTKIVEYGPKVLQRLSELFLKQTPVEDNQYASTSKSRLAFDFARYVGYLGTESDCDLILEAISHPYVLKEFDNSAMHMLTSWLKKYIHIKRTREPSDPKLEEIAKKLINIYHAEKLSSHKKDHILSCLAYTGTETAKSLGLDNYSNENQLILTKSEISAPYYSERDRPTTWEEYQERISQSSSDEYRSDFTESDLGDDDYGYDSGSYYDYDYRPSLGIGYEDYNSLSKDEIELVEKAKNQNMALGLEESMGETARLHLYNFFKKNQSPTEAELNSEIKKLDRLSALETIYSRDDNPLPTIGIEIELPSYAADGPFSPKMISLIDQLKISNQSEGSNLHEVHPNYSYSPNAQSQLIQELGKLGAIPLNSESEDKITPLGTVDTAYDPISMHINLGFPVEITESAKEYNERHMELLTNCLTYAFSSARRLKTRKTSTSYQFNKSAKNSKKNKSKDSSEYNSPWSIRRLEVRSMEFKNYTSFRLLTESQRLGAMLFAYLKMESKVELTPLENELARLWQSFYDEASDNLYKKYGTDGTDIDYDKYKVADLMEKTPIQAEARQLITKYSKAVISRVKPLLDSTEIAIQLKNETKIEKNELTK